MYNNNKSTLSKDTIFEASNHTNSTTSSLEDISVARAKEALQRMLNKNTFSLFSVIKRVEV